VDLVVAEVREERCEYGRLSHVLPRVGGVAVLARLGAA